MNTTTPDTTPDTTPEYFIDERGMRWLNVKFPECQCADCAFEREQEITLRTRKQCQA